VHIGNGAGSVLRLFYYNYSIFAVISANRTNAVDVEGVRRFAGYMVILVTKAAIVPMIIRVNRPRGIRPCRVSASYGGGMSRRQVRLEVIVTYTPVAAIAAFRFNKFRATVLTP